ATRAESPAHGVQGRARSSDRDRHGSLVHRPPRGRCTGLCAPLLPGSPAGRSGHVRLRLTHVVISLVTGWLPASPLIQPPMIDEKRPAGPPAWTISSPSG